MQRPNAYATSSSQIGSFYSPGYAGLPARKSISDPQHALIHALASPRGTPLVRGGPSPPTQGDMLMVQKARQQAQKATPMRPVGPPCDRCDGNHRTRECPHFKGSRDNHEDATTGLGKGGKEDEDAAPFIVRASIVRQPGDGSCLFHSLGHTLGESAQELRAVVSRFIEANAEAKIAGTALSKWVTWDCGLDTKAYAARLRQPGRWGGALEMSIIAEIKGISIHVYERHGSGQFKRIATFGDVDDTTAASAHVLYGGRVHYDCLENLVPVSGQSNL